MSDTRVLTDRGFLFYDQLLSLVSAGQSVLYACYDEGSQQLVYQPGELIPAYQAAELLEFTQRGESRNWGSDSDAYGHLHPRDDDSNNDHFSIRATPNHLMFVQMGNRGKKGAAITWAKQTPQRIAAGELVPSKPSGDAESDDDDDSAVEEEQQEQEEAISDTSSHVRFLSYAAAGVGSADESAVVSMLECELGLQMSQVAAFLELFGFWLGDGGTDLARKRITFSQTKQSDREWLRNILPTLLEPEQLYACKLKGERERFHTAAPLWWRFFTQSEQAAQECVESDTETSDDDHSLPAVQFPPWVQSCSKDQLRAIVRGLRRADGAWTKGQEAKSVIHTSNIWFRDALVHILLRAGYASYFEVAARAGTVCGYREMNGSLVLRPAAYDQLSKEEQMLYTAFTAKHDQWAVHWTDATNGGASTAGLVHPQLARSRIRKVPGEMVWCVNVSHKDNLVVMQRAARGLDGRVTKASTPVVIGNCMLFTPVCPHSLSFRPLLFPDTSTLQIKINSESRGNNCASFDGRHRATLNPGDSLLISMSRWPLPSICRVDGTTDWFDGVRSVLQWNSRSASQKSFNPSAGAASAATNTAAATAAAAAKRAAASPATATHQLASHPSSSGSSSGLSSPVLASPAASGTLLASPHPQLAQRLAQPLPTAPVIEEQHSQSAPPARDTPEPQA